jgi:hypothetical protein
MYIWYRMRIWTEVGRVEEGVNGWRSSYNTVTSFSEAASTTSSTLFISVVVAK